MNTNTSRYGAPWGSTLKLATGIIIVMMLVIIAIGVSSGPRDIISWYLVMVGIPLAIILVGMLFIIRGYELTDKKLLILRPGWRTTISLDGLESVTFKPGVMARSIRLWGNGGLFCFAGSFRNKELGTYRGYVNDGSKTVVLKFNDRNPVVISPDQPEQFAAELEAQIDR
jgi:hypothetical protein